MAAFLIWALVAAGVAFWGLRLGVRPAALPPHVQAVDTRVVAGGDFVRMFGAAPVAEVAAPAPAAESSRFKLVGVLAPVAHEGGESTQGGVALIAVDGKAAKPFAIGASLDADLILQSVGRRSASIGPSGGAASVVLELPPPAPPATGTPPLAAPESMPIATPREVNPAAPRAAVDDAASAAALPAHRADGKRAPEMR